MEIKTTTETTNNFQFCYDDEILDGTGKFSFDYYSNDMDGIFRNKASWTRFVNRVDNGELLQWLSYKNKYGYIKEIDFNKIEIYNKYGFNIATGYVLDENNNQVYVYDTYKKVQIEIDYEFYYNSKDWQCSTIEIYGKILKVEK